MITQLPGFRDAVHDTQVTFKALMNALAHPGQPHAIPASLMPPEGLTPAGAAACLTLLDLETQVWLQPGFDPALQSWLVFHTGCCFTSSPQMADFALIGQIDSLLDLTNFNTGTPEYPEASTTLLIQVERLDQGKPVEVRGPGILDKSIMAPQLPNSFWQQWRQSHQNYPMGVDAFFLAQHAVMGLPRTTQVQD